MNDFWTVIEAYWDNCEIEIVNDAGVKTGNSETEEADRCKITHRPDGRVLGECGENLSWPSYITVTTEKLHMFLQ